MTGKAAKARRGRRDRVHTRLLRPQMVEDEQPGEEAEDDIRG